MKARRVVGLAVLGLFIFLILAFYYFDLGRFATLDSLKEHALWLSECAKSHYFLCVSVYLFLFASIIAFSLPLTGPLTLLGGFLFGVVRGSLYSGIAATAGCTVAFLLFRRGLDELSKGKYRTYTKRLEKFNKKIARYGVSYLLVMHFSTVVPYAVINVLAAMASIPLRTVVWTTAVGFVPTALIYTFAGSRLTKITSISDIFSLKIILAFVLLIILALLPAIIKRIGRGKWL